ncbi:hypothetical protein pb186bvf_015844 [Paramecium bursaria]
MNNILSFTNLANFPFIYSPNYSHWSEFINQLYHFIYSQIFEYIQFSIMPFIIHIDYVMNLSLAIIQLKILQGQSYKFTCINCKFINRIKKHKKNKKLTIRNKQNLRANTTIIELSQIQNNHRKAEIQKKILLMNAGS